MKVSEYQINMVVKTYVRNNKERLSGSSPLSTDRRYNNDDVRISDQGKMILFERMGKRVIDKIREEASHDL